MKFNKKILIIIAFLSVVIIAYIITKNESNIEKEDLQRPGYSEQEKQLDLSVYVGKKRIDTTLVIEPEKYTQEQIQTIFEQIEEDLKDKIKNDNSSLDNIKTNLNLITSVAGIPVDIEWYSDDYNTIDYDGVIHNDDFDEDEKRNVKLTAVLSYMEYLHTCEYEVVVCNKDVSVEDKAVKDILHEIRKSEENMQQTQINLPDEINGEKVIYKKRNQTNYVGVVIFLGTALIAGFYCNKKEKKKKINDDRIKQLKCDYSEIIAKISLLIGAGMTVRMAWEKIVNDYKIRCKKDIQKRYAYELMAESLNRLKAGESQIMVYEEFGMRCNVKEYMKFSSLIVQNIKKGTKELSALLSLEARSAFEERKNQAKKYGEEAGTKLLLPMIIMLIVVMAIVMTPAIMEFSI